MKQPAGRLLCVSAVLLLVMALGNATIMTLAARSYTDELTQRLNASIAMYVSERLPLIRNGMVDIYRLNELAKQATIINPIAHVYLLDTQGEVIGGGRGNVDLQPVQRFLRGIDGPIYGNDPANKSKHRIFSAFPLKDHATPVGYVYVTLGGGRAESLSVTIASSHILQVAIASVALLLLLGIATATVLTNWVTKPLSQLYERVLSLREQLNPQPLGSPRARAGSLNEVRAAVDALGAQALQQVNALNQADQQRRSLFEDVGHDLRTPLTAIRGYVETLIEQGQRLDVVERIRHLTIVHQHCDRLSRLVEQIFRLARLESPSLDLRIEPVLVQELVQDIAAKFQLSHDSGSPRVILKVDWAAPAVWGDYALLETILENLLDNALRHGGQQGPITLKVVSTAAVVVVSVEDHGPGMSADMISLAAGVCRRANERKGLGLLIVSRALQHLGSALGLRSAYGAGTCASFALQPSAKGH